MDPEHKYKGRTGWTKAFKKVEEVTEVKRRLRPILVPFNKVCKIGTMITGDWWGDES
jgi:hypothetical protein